MSKSIYMATLIKHLMILSLVVRIYGIFFINFLTLPQIINNYLWLVFE